MLFSILIFLYLIARMSDLQLEALGFLEVN